MPHSDGLKFKHTLMDLNFARAPEVAHLHAVSRDRTLRSGTVPATGGLSDQTIRLPPVTQRYSRTEQPASPPPAEPAAEAVAAEVLPRENPEAKETIRIWNPSEAIVRAPSPSPSVVVEQAEIPADVDSRLVMLYDHASVQARAYRLLRHRLLARSDPRVITVTSAQPGEGKTTCAVNLALALADETMSRVLLVEANLRRPALGEVFGYEPSDSFVRRLVEHRDASPPYPVAGVVGTRLHIAALPSRRTRELRLDRLLFGTALHELRTAYDYVVIDAAAVLESADADVAGECADGVILVTRSQVSRKAAVARATEQLHPSRVLGTVVLDT
ncbi:MAG TPA: CpsD/CapB family tyrosine-protein kinase [Polyangiaceae bacterium]|jgi:Mrp family chromosome partitioning ATPase|nr:CpsD/CapB family tyrosine-protein kinase [Polyangiaceae bacterium]